MKYGQTGVWVCCVSSCRTCTWTLAVWPSLILSGWRISTMSATEDWPSNTRETQTTTCSVSKALMSVCCHHRTPKRKFCFLSFLFFFLEHFKKQENMERNASNHLNTSLIHHWFWMSCIHHAFCLSLGLVVYSEAEFGSAGLPLAPPSGQPLKSKITAAAAAVMLLDRALCLIRLKSWSNLLARFWPLPLTVTLGYQEVVTIPRFPKKGKWY